MTTLFLFNTTIVTGLPGFGTEEQRSAANYPDAVYRVVAMSEYDARCVITDALRKGEKVVSAIGHEATADAMGIILGTPVQVNRIQAEQEPGDRAICLKIRGRLPEGVVLDAEQLEEIGYDLFLLQRVQ